MAETLKFKTGIVPWVTDFEWLQNMIHIQPKIHLCWEAAFLDTDKLWAFVSNNSKKTAMALLQPAMYLIVRIPIRSLVVHIYHMKLILSENTPVKLLSWVWIRHYKWNSTKVPGTLARAYANKHVCIFNFMCGMSLQAKYVTPDSMICQYLCCK